VPGERTIDLTAWDVDPFILLGLMIATGLYVSGWRRLYRRARPQASPPMWQAWAFGGSIAALAVALLSPLATLDGVLFSAHMLQHLLLIQVAAPLLLLSSPIVPLLWGLPNQKRRGAARLFFGPRSALRPIGHLLTEPAVAATLFLGCIAVWHTPVLYDAAHGRSGPHVLEHAVFLTSAIVYWWPLLHPGGGQRRLGFGASIFYLLPPLLGSNALGALFTFAGQPLYRTYLAAPRVTSLSPLDDQQLGGLLMWVVGGMLWAVAVFVAVAVFLQREEDEVRRSESTTLAPHAGR